MKTLADRLRYLIDRSHQGSVNAAAKGFGLPQRTLFDLVAGVTENPRTESLRRVAAFYGIKLDWLITGEGSPPKVPHRCHCCGQEITGR